MQYKFIHFLLNGLYTILLVSCFVMTPITAYADATSGISCIEINNGVSNGNQINEDINEIDKISGYRVSEDTEIFEDSLTDEDDDKLDEPETMKYWKIGMFALFILARVIGAMMYRRKSCNRDILLGLLVEFDKQYDEYKRYYAYCVEEFAKIEKKGNFQKKNTVLSIREDMKEVYNKVIEMKKQRNRLVLSDRMMNKKALKTKIDTMKYLCKNEVQYQKRLERYLKELREINELISMNPQSA